MNGVLGLLLVCGLQIGCDSGYSARQTIDLRPRIVEIQDHHGGTRRITDFNKHMLTAADVHLGVQVIINPQSVRP